MSNQDKETIVLLPCPVCGEIPNTKTESLDERYAYARKVQFKCEKCGISAGAVGDQSKGGYADNSKVDENALANWNAKANSPVIAKLTARIAELEDVADKLYQSVNEVMQMQVNDHQLQYMMQFSMRGRAIGGKAYAARKLYESTKGGA